MTRAEDFYKVNYFQVGDQEGTVYSLITKDVDWYYNNDPDMTGIEVFNIKKCTEREYQEQEDKC